MEEENAEKIKKERDECKKLAEDYLAGWKRERADFINFKRDESERIQKSVKLSEKEIVKNFLLILDSLYLLEKHSKNIEGFSNVNKQISAFLDSMKVKEIDCLNKEFDPNLHEAVEVIEGKEEIPIVVEIVQKGYIMDNMVVRPVKVKIANKIDKPSK